MARGVLACPCPLAGPPAVPSLLNVDGERDCPYPLSTPAARASSKRRRHGPEREFAPSANDHEARHGKSRRAVRHGAAGDARRERIYVTVAVAQMLDAGVPMPWGGRAPLHRAASGSGAAHPAGRAASRRSRRAQLPADLHRTPRTATQVPRDLWFEVEHDARRRTCFTSATARPRAHTATRAGRRPGGPTSATSPGRMRRMTRAARASASEGLDELAKWPHLAEALRASARRRRQKACEDAQRRRGLPVAARRRGGNARRAALREEERRRAPRGGGARTARERSSRAEEQPGRVRAEGTIAQPASPPNPHSAGKGRMGALAESPCPPRWPKRRRGVVVIDADDTSTRGSLPAATMLANHD
ncbi:hypothetical protein QYE76_036782 [Lolium multiflorum]|uniref:Uncharacterized protein n=1 Tax=Lolium multiflorum TaxID=4521 RepID=A0AAD8R529_LOLMU|nr:hypothetical protein QYE76_036782 [Lolium multiflorum]